MLAALRKEGRQLMTDAGELFDQHGRRTAAEAQGVACSGVAVREHLSCEERLGEPGLVSLEKRELQPLKYHLRFSTKEPSCSEAAVHDFMSLKASSHPVSRNAGPLS